MSNLVKYAKKELDLLLETIDKTDKQAIKMQKLMHDDVLEVIQVISRQEHSGFSMGYFKNQLDRLMMFKPLLPLTGEDSEWNEVGENLEQNNRCYSVFRENGDNLTAYNNSAKIFSDDGGQTWYSSNDSREKISFPYTVPREPKEIMINKEDKNT